MVGINEPVSVGQVSQQFQRFDPCVGPVKPMPSFFPSTPVSQFSPPMSPTSPMSLNPPTSPSSPMSLGSPASSFSSPPAYSPGPNAQPGFSPTPPAVKRRPVPLPPPKVIRTVTATHLFTPHSDQELGFLRGQSLEILDDTSDDGWWKARITATEKVGMIPCTFVK